MSKKANNYYNKSIHALQELHDKYPDEPLGRHIYAALSEYGDFWGISDKELFHLIEKYKSTHELDVDIDTDKVIEDGLNLEKLFLTEDEYGNS